MDGEMLFTVAAPAAVGVLFVILTVVLIFWYGTGRQTSYEDAMKVRQGRAEKELRKQTEKEKEQKQKKEKKRLGEKKRKQEAGKPGSQGEVETTPKLPPAQRSILKSSSEVKDKVDSSSASRVDFELSETPVKSRGARINPPTPHPSAPRFSGGHPLAKALEEEEEELLFKAPSVGPQKRAPDDDQPKPKPRAATQPAVAVAPPTKAATGGSSRSQKKPKKAKPTVDLGSMEALPASRIVDIVTASSLSDDDIQQLIDQLLEKMNTNAEWQAANKGGTESVKSLKKANEDLQSRCKDAEKTVQTHFNKIKDLRSEIQREQSRRQASEGQLQSKISQHSNEITIWKTKMSGLEEELKQTRSLSSSHAYQKLQEEYTSLQRQMSSIAQENSTLAAQLTSQSNTLQESQEQCSRFKLELRRAKEAAKSPGGEGRGHAERASELEARLRQAEDENVSLQSALKSMDAEKDRLAEKIQSLPGVTRERDSLSQQLSATQQQLQNTQVSVQSLKQKVEEMGAEGGKEEEKLQGEIQQLRAENTQLGSQVDSLLLQQQSAVMAVQQPEGVSTEEMESMTTQLQAEHMEERQALMAEMEAKRTTDVAQLQAQYEAELHSMKEELSRVQRAGEQETASMKEQLSSEMASKQELQSELESLKLHVATLSTQQNGPVGKEETDTRCSAKEDQVDRTYHEEVLRAKEEDLARAVEERDQLKDKLKSTESKLDELKGKNNSLRDSCWKARDESAKVEKEFEAKLKQVYKETESRVKLAEAKVSEEMEEGQRALLQRLFPDVAVDATSFPAWLDQFESQAQLTIEDTKKQLSELTERVEELEESEHHYIQETQGFRETLNIAFGNLAKLQAEVNGESIKNSRLLEERDDMLQRERQTNRDLQQQLSKEKEATANLEAELKKAGSEEEEQQERARELEKRLEESSQHGETLRQEVDNLRHSLQQETELKSSAEGKIIELESKCSDLEKKRREAEESLQSTVELGKIGQSIVIPSDSTEV